jgi:hypothetical protein
MDQPHKQSQDVTELKPDQVDNDSVSNGQIAASWTEDEERKVRHKIDIRYGPELSRNQSS